MPLPNISPELLKAYQEEIAKRTSPATAKRKASSLRRFFSWAHQEGHIDENPLAQPSGSIIAQPPEKPKPSFFRFSNILRFAGLAGLVVLVFLLAKRVQISIPWRLAPATEEEIVQQIPQPTPVPQEFDTKAIIAEIREEVLKSVGDFSIDWASFEDGNLLIGGDEVSEMALSTADTSDGDITINPDGAGIAHFLFEGTSSNFLNAQAPNLIDGSLYYGIVANNATEYDLVKLQSGSKPITRFSVDALGNTYIDGDLNVEEDISTDDTTRLTAEGELENITGYTQTEGNFTISQTAGESATIIKKNTTALSDLLVLTLDERGKPETSNSIYSTLVLNRYDGSREAMALLVDEGNTQFDGQLRLGRFSTNPDAIGTGSLVYNSTDNKVYAWNGSAWEQVGSSTMDFSNITSGTNTSAAMIVGTGASLTYSGTGTINASSLESLTASQFLRSDTSDNYTSGTLAFDAGTTLDVNGDFSVADTNIAFDGATTTFTTTGDLTINSGGGDLILSDAVSINIGGSGNDVAYNVIGDSTTGASGSVDSDDDLYIEGNLEVDGTIYGNVSGTITPGFTEGSVVFIDSAGALAQDNPNFFWDNTEKRLGIGTTVPSVELEISGHLKADTFKTDETTNHTVFIGDDAGGSGTHTTFVGEHAGESNSGNYSNALGYQALQNNTGNYSNALGYQALQNNTGVSSTAVGHLALWLNTGASSTAIGNNALRNNIGNNSTAIGATALQYNTGINSSALGDHALQYNTGINSSALGDHALTNNDGDYNTALGRIAFNTWTADTGSAEAVDVVVFANNQFTITGHGLGANDTYLNLVATTTGALPTGLAATAQQWKIIDVNTIQCMSDTFSDTGTGTHTVTPKVIYSNSTALGYNAEPDASNQVMLGDANVTQIKTTGSLYSSGAGDNYFAGDVGIGTTGPLVKLHVQDNTNTDIEIARFDSHGGPGDIQGKTYIGFHHWITDNTYPSARIGVEEMGVADYDAKLVFQTRNSNSDSLPETRMTILDTGNVGIGTTGPSDKLEVSGGALRLSGSVSYVSGVNRIYSTSANGLVISPSLGGTGNDFSLLNKAGNIIMQNPAGTTTVAFNSGNVGIGTTGPDAPLDVLSTGGEQLRLTYADGSTYTSFNTDTNGDLTINPTGGEVFLSDTDTLIIGGHAGSVDYNVIANSGEAPEETGVITSDNDLYIGGDLEVDGTIYGNSVGSFAWDDLTDPDNTLALSMAEYTTAFTWDTADTAATLDAFTLAITNDATTDANTQRLLVLANNDYAGATGTTERLLVLDNKDANEAVTTALEILASSTGTITTAIDVSDAEIGTALSAGGNTIAITTGTIGSNAATVVDFAEFDISGSTGAITINDDGDLGKISIEGTILDIDSLNFVGAGTVTSAAGNTITLDVNSGDAAGEDLVITANNISLAAIGVLSITPDVALTTAIDVTDTDLTNAISVGTNKILGTTGDIDYDKFDVIGSTGNITTAGDIAIDGGNITSTVDLDINASGGDLTIPTRATIGSSSAGVGKLTVTGAEIGKALVVLDETGDQNILTASASSTPVANLTRTGDLELLNQGDLRLYELTVSGTDYTGFQAPDDVTTTVVYKLPAADGSVNQVLSTDNSGNLSWIDVGAGAGSLWTDGGTYIYPTSGEVLGNSASAGADKIAGIYLADSSPLYFGTDNDINYSFSGSTLAVTTGTNDINFDANTLFIDGSESRVGIGTTGPGNILHAYLNDASDIAAADGSTLILEQDSTGDSGIQFELTGGQVFSLGIDNSSTNDDFILFDGSTARLTVDGSNGDITVASDLTVSGGDITLGITAILTGGDVTSLDNIDVINAVTETTIETQVFDADTKNILGIWEVQDNVGFVFGNDANFTFQYDETADDRLEITALSPGSDVYWDLVNAVADSTFIITNSDVTHEANFQLEGTLDINGAGTHDIAGALNLSGNSLTSSGDLVINPTGGDAILSNAVTLNIGGSGSDVAYNVIGDSTAGASGNVGSDDDLYIEGNLEVDGTIYDPSGNVIAGYWTLNGSDLYATDVNYQVGIGTTGPGAKLHVHTTGSTNARGYFTAAGTGDAGVYFDASDGDIVGTDYGSLIQLDDLSVQLNNYGDNPLYLKTNSLNRVTILGNGNVGIGTTDPGGADLMVSGGTGNGAGGGNTDLWIGESLTHNLVLAWKDAATDYAAIETYGGSGNLALQTNGGNVGIGTTSPDAKLDISGSSLNSTATVNHYRDVVSTSTSGNPTTGTLKITLPKLDSNTMLQIKINGYNYSINPGAWEILIGGYNYSTNWVNTSVTINGSPPFTSVRLAEDASNDIILLGTTTTNWYYPKVTVSEVITGHNNISGWGTGWSMAFITDETGITVENTPTIKMYINTAGNVGIGTTAPGETLDVAGDIRSTTGSLQIGNSSNLAYSRFGIATTGHALSAANDVLVSGKLEVNGVLYPDSGIADSDGTVTITMDADEDVTLVGDLYVAGRVGIGTTSPGYYLDIAGSGDTYGIEFDNGDAYITTHDGFGNFNIKSGVDDDNIIVAGTGGSHIKLDEAGGIHLLIDEGTAESGNFSTSTSLVVNGGTVSITGSGTMLTVGGGSGKVDVGTVDPVYNIGGEKYATYMAGMIGVKEEISGVVKTNQYIPGVGYKHTIDFTNQERGSDLWLFSKATDIGKHIDHLVVLLSSSGNTRSWYEIDKENYLLSIYTSQPTSVSYRLTAPRFDAADWSNYNTNPESFGFVLDDDGLIGTGETNQEIPGLSDYEIFTENARYKIRTISGEIIEGIEAFAGLAVANIKAGAIETTDLVVSSSAFITDTLRAGAVETTSIATDTFLAFQGTVDNLLITNGLISPVIETSMISPLADSDIVIDLENTSPDSTESSFGKLLIEGVDDEVVASIDAEGNA
ncbi:hypothetical protein KAT60_00140, partial [Candidatus Woesebacteria bacterium]|nr:hypothetical protein [Candidatus Woesebacteria bacterium]